MIRIEGLTKVYGSTAVVDDLSFTVEPGTVTGFLGPNGAGKSTTLRSLVGLDRPTRGRALVGGREHRHGVAPLREVGVLLDAGAVHPSRTAYAHLLALAVTHRIPASRVDEVLAMVGLTDVAHQRAGGYSLGMRQRLGIAGALLGDPSTVVLDEPVNGLDPEGIRWIRELLVGLADDGRTVLLSSHLMSEMALTAERLVVIGQGRLLADTTVRELTASAEVREVLVASPRIDDLTTALREAGALVRAAHPGTVVVERLDALEVGRVAARHRIALSELSPRRASLEEAFMELTRTSLQFSAGADRSIEVAA